MLKLAPAPFYLYFFLTFVYAGQIFKHDLTPIVLWCQMVSYGWCAWLANLANLAGQVEFIGNSVVYSIIKYMLCQSGISMQQIDSVLLFSTSSTIKKNNVFSCITAKCGRKNTIAYVFFFAK